MSTHHAFQTEVAQLLHLVTHSLYSNKDIFLRELISNASDACDRLRFEALDHAALFEDAPTLEVRVGFDAEAKTLTISDNGIGMSEAEAIEHLGTIAKSGTKAFMSRLSGDQQKDAQLIGQFGVGFYSGFIVADRITVESRRAGLPPEQGVRWVSAGTGEFETETITRAERGTCITLHLRDDASEYLTRWKLKGIIGKYSDHISLPILMRKEEWDADKGESVLRDEWEQVNAASALWTRPKKDLSEQQYSDFYQAISHDYEAPLAWSHNRVEGTTEYTQLLYIPAKAPHDLWNRDKKPGVKLYVRRVFIMDEAEALLPSYLRWVKGVIDSADLPLNVSRELLQESRDVKAIREGNTRRVLALLEDLAQQGVEPAAAATEATADPPPPPPLLRRVWRRAQRRAGRGLWQPRAHRAPAALCLHPERCRGREPGRLQGAHESGPESDLLPHGRQPGRGQEQPAARAVSQKGHRGAADDRSGR